jgi:hypothetical protein
MKKYNNYSFVLINQGKTTYQSKSRGLTPLIFCFKNYQQEMRGVAVFDKVVGRAAALILAETGIKKVLTPLICEEAIKILRAKKIKVEYTKKVKNILNRAGDDLCPMEKLSAGKNFKELKRALRF